MKSTYYTLFITIIFAIGVFLFSIIENPYLKVLLLFPALCGLVVKALRARYSNFDDYIEKLREKNIILRILLENRKEETKD